MVAIAVYTKSFKILRHTTPTSIYIVHKCTRRSIAHGILILQLFVLFFLMYDNGLFVVPVKPPPQSKVQLHWTIIVFSFANIVQNNLDEFYISNINSC